VETQLLHFDGEDWRGYTYSWREDGSDADLVPVDGAEKLLTVVDARAPGGKREMAWTFHSRQQCMVCHNSWSEYALAFSLGQLNHNNQLVTLSEVGYVSRVAEDDKQLPPFDSATAAKERSFKSGKPAGSKADIEERARAYLHVNCSHCHRFGGGGGQVVLEMDFSRPLAEMGILDIPPRQGAFDLPGARIVKPGDPCNSVLFYRLAKFGRGRMPHLGSEVPDGNGLEIIARWIESLGDKLTTEPAAGEITKGDLAKSLATPDAALPLARRLAGKPDAEAIQKVVAAVAPLPHGPVRDLFEGYLPPDPRGRKLGANPKPAAILALRGDAGRGEALFFAKDLKCATCHKLGDKGTAIGPELTTIGKTRTRAEILESLLQPSLVIEAKFAQYLLQTADGKTHSGLLVRRDDKQVVLRDAENKEVVVKAEDVELFRPSRVSLMPEGQMGGLLPQEAADLLEFLSTRR
jgi:putative heme-binding domain-containing protein